MQVAWPAVDDSNETIVSVGSRPGIGAVTSGGLRITAPHITYSFLHVSVVLRLQPRSCSSRRFFVERFTRLSRLTGGFKVG